MRFKFALAGLLSVICLPASANIVLMHIFNFDFGQTPPTHSNPIIEAGDTVRWVVDSGFHSTTAAGGTAEQWDSGFIGVGATFDHTFTTVGDWPYYCAIHGFDLGGGQVGGMAGHVIVANTYHPTSFSAVRGKFISGGLSDIQNSDDQYLIYERGAVANFSEAAIQVNFKSTLATAQPTILAFSIEDGSNANGLTRRIELLNVQTNQLEQIYQGALLPADHITVASPTGDLSRFVNQTTKEITAKVSYPALGPISIVNFRANFDRIAFLSN